MYELEGVVFITDNRGRPHIVHGIVDRTREVERISGLDTLLGQEGSDLQSDVGFHLGADQLGFPGGPLNIAPGDRTLNNTSYRELENRLSTLSSEMSVEVQYQAVFYTNNNGNRPDEFRVTYRLGDSDRLITETFPNQAPGN